MRKKVFASTVLVVVLCMSLISTAFAYSNTLSLNYSYNYGHHFSNIVRSNASASILDFLQVNLHVYNLSSGKVICDDYNSTDSPTSSSLICSASFSSLAAGTYVNEGVGVVRYGSQYSADDQTIISTQSFTISSSGRASSSSSVADDAAEDTLDTFKTRGYEIAQSFDLDTSGYQCVVNSKIQNYLDSVLDYLSIKQSLSLSYGDTIPVYFLSEDGNTLFAVKRDSDSVNYLFTFEKNDEGDWILNSTETCLAEEGSQSSGNDEVLASTESFAISFGSTSTSSSSVVDDAAADTLDTFKTRGYEIAQSFDLDTSGYQCVVNSKIQNYLDSVLDYLSIKQSLSLSYGDTIPVYFLSEDGNTLFAVKRDSDSVNYLFTFEKNDEEDWILNNTETSLSDTEASS